MLRHKEPYVLYRKLLGFYPTDIHLYEQACLHRSSSICEQGRRINNERLEFLGDAILDAIRYIVPQIQNEQRRVSHQHAGKNS